MCWNVISNTRNGINKNYSSDTSMRYSMNTIVKRLLITFLAVVLALSIPNSAMAKEKYISNPTD